MTELKERFALADEIDARDLWNEARRRAEAPGGSSPAVDWPPGIGRRIAVGAVAFAVFASAVLFAWDLSHPEQAPSPPRPVALEPVDLAAELGPGWSELPGPPEVLSGSANAWTGSELIMWGGGGDDYVTADGYAFDTNSREWRPIPDGPLSARSEPASAWTGRELLIWGGRTECCDGSTTLMGDGAAFDPTTETWRPLAPAPIEARSPFSAWTGDELLVWGSQDRDVRYSDGAAYNPATDTWRRIADGPIEITDGTAAWTGNEMLVFGAALHGGNVPESETAIGASYDPDTDSWQALPPSIDTDPNANTAVWTDERLIAVDYDADAEAFEPATGRWRRLEPLPMHDGEDVPRAAYGDGWTLVNFFGQVAAFSSEKERWTDLTDEVPGMDPPHGVPLAAGGAFLLPIRSSELSEVPSVEFDTKLLVWVPPAASSDRADDPTPFVPQTEVVGDETWMPIVFPDGSEATLAYAIPLGLEQMGVQPDVTYSFRGAYQGPIVFLHDREASIRGFVDREGAPMLINSSVGGIELWPARGDNNRSWIRLELPSWTVLVPIEVVGSDSPAERAGLAASVAGSLNIRETASGFPVVAASGEAVLAEGFGEAGGAQLAFGDAAAEPDMVSQLDATIFLSPDGCDPATVDASSACLGGGTVFASIYGGRDFIARIVDGLTVEGFRRA